MSGEALSVKIWAAISLPAFLCFSFIDHLTFISYISILSYMTIALFGLFGVLYDVIPLASNPTKLPLFNSFCTFALFFGQSVFAFEGIGVVSLSLYLHNIHDDFQLY